MRNVSPGLAGWVAVAAVVAMADGYALVRRRETMSDFFASHSGWGFFLLGGTAMHLMTHRSQR